MRVRMMAAPPGSPEGDPRRGGLSTDATSAGRGASHATRVETGAVFRGRRVKGRPSQDPKGSVLARRGASVGDHPSAPDLGAVDSARDPRHRMTMALGHQAVVAAAGSLVMTSPPGTSLGRNDHLETSLLEGSLLVTAGKEARQPAEAVRQPLAAAAAMVRRRPPPGASSRRPLRQPWRAPCRPEG